MPYLHAVKALRVQKDVKTYLESGRKYQWKFCTRNWHVACLCITARRI